MNGALTVAGGNCNLSLWEEEIPSVSRETLIHARQDGDEVGFERADCLLSFVASVHVWRYLLELTLPDFGDVVEELGADFVIHELHVHCQSTFLEALHEDIVCRDTMMIGLRL